MTFPTLPSRLVDNVDLDVLCGGDDLQLVAPRDAGLDAAVLERLRHDGVLHRLAGHHRVCDGKKVSCYHLKMPFKIYCFLY